MLGSRVALTMHFVLAAGLRVVLEDCSLGSMLGSPDFVRCRSGLGLGFSIHFYFASLARFVSCTYLSYIGVGTKDHLSSIFPTVIKVNLIGQFHFTHMFKHRG